MISSRFFLPLTAVALMAPAAFAGSSAVGTWNGHLTMSMTPTLSTTPQQQQQMNMAKSLFSKMHFVMNLKANHTYTVTVSGAPGGKSQTETGTWSQNNKLVTVKSDKKTNGPQTQVFTMSANGKSMKFALPSRAGFGGELLFTR